MSRVVIGYRDGHAVYRDEGPARARPVGWGGSSIGHFSGTVIVIGRVEPPSSRPES